MKLKLNQLGLSLTAILGASALTFASYAGATTANDNQQGANVTTDQANNDQNNTNNQNNSKSVTKPTSKPSKEQLAGIKKLVEKAEDLKKKVDASDANSAAAGQELEALLAEIAKNPDVQSLYDYFKSLDQAGREAYVAENTRVTAGQFKNSLEINGKAVSGQNLYDLRSKKAALDEAKAKQQAAKEALQAQIKDSVDLFKEVASLFTADSGVKYETVTDHAAFTASVTNLETKVAGLEVANLLATANGDYSVDTTTKELFAEVSDTEEEETTKDSVVTNTDKGTNTDENTKVEDDAEAANKVKTEPENKDVQDDESQNKKLTDNNDQTEVKNSQENQEVTNTQSINQDAQQNSNQQESGPSTVVDDSKQGNQDNTNNQTDSNNQTNTNNQNSNIQSDDSGSVEDNKTTDQTNTEANSEGSKENSKVTTDNNSVGSGNSENSSDQTQKTAGNQENGELQNQEGQQNQQTETGTQQSENNKQTETEKTEETSTVTHTENEENKVQGTETQQLGVYLASVSDVTLSSSTTEVANVTSALDVVEKLLKENADNAIAVKTLNSLKEKLTTLKTALETANQDVAETAAKTKEAEDALVAYAKEIGIAENVTEATAATVLAEITKTLSEEASSTSLLAALVAQQTAEAYYNEAATSQVLASAIAESQLAQGRYLLQSVRGQAQGAFANVFYNSKNLSVLDVTYPTLVLGADYQIVPSAKAGAAVTVSTATLDLDRASTNLQDTAYGINAFVDYADNGLFATALVGYTRHQLFGNFLADNYDASYNSFDFAARVGYDFDFAESGKASVAGVYQFNSLGFTKLKTHVFGVEADYKYKLDNTFELTAGLGVYFQSHNKAKVAVPSYVQVVNSTLVDFGKNAYKKSGAAVAVNLGLTSYIAKNSVLSTEFGYQRDPRGSSNYNVNVGYRFKFN